MSKESLVVFEANMRQAERSHYARTRDGGLYEEVPFARMMAIEDEATGIHPPTEDDFYQRRMGVMGFLRYLLSEGPSALKIMKRLYAAGAAMHMEPFCSMTAEERGLMFSDTKAAAAWRLKKLSGEIERQGMKGSRLPGQKTKGASASYSKAQMGNSNRRRKRRRS